MSVEVYYIEESAKTSIYIGSTVIKNTTSLFNPDGKVSRTLKNGETIRVYSYDNQKYQVGGGYYIKKDKDVVFYEGQLKSYNEYPLYSSDGKVVRTIRMNESLHVYSIDGERFNVGGGYYVINDKKKMKFLRN